MIILLKYLSSVLNSFDKCLCYILVQRRHINTFLNLSKLQISKQVQIKETGLNIKALQQVLIYFSLWNWKIINLVLGSDKKTGCDLDNISQNSIEEEVSEGHTTWRCVWKTKSFLELFQLLLCPSRRQTILELSASTVAASVLSVLIGSSSLHCTNKWSDVGIRWQYTPRGHAHRYNTQCVCLVQMKRSTAASWFHWHHVFLTFFLADVQKKKELNSQNVPKWETDCDVWCYCSTQEKKKKIGAESRK